MGQVMKSYLGIFFLLVMGLVGIGIVAAGMEANAARNYHADVVTEIECSNFRRRRRKQDMGWKWKAWLMMRKGRNRWRRLCCPLTTRYRY